MKTRKIGRRLGAVGAASALLVTGCGARREDAGEAASLAVWLSSLTNLAEMARLDVPSCSLISSRDPAGGNQDYNHFAGASRTRGWVVMADLDGPGVVRRFWFTGGDSTHRIRMYFDGESRPRLDLSVGDLCGGRAPFLPPLAAYENYAYYCWIPFPFARRLRIECEAGGWKPDGKPLVFYQINYARLPPGTPVRSFPRKLSVAETEMIESVRRTWAQGARPGGDASVETVAAELVLPPGTVSNGIVLAGPAVLRELRVTPRFDALPSAGSRERLLRDMLLRIRWNGEEAASVEVPLGDFFGSVWRLARFQSLFMGAEGNTLECRFPMPYERSASIALANEGDTAVTCRVEVAREPLTAWDPALGYFHSGWFRTSPTDVGRPHPIVHARGRGRYAGCVLAVTSLNRSYWILEGDETIRRDGEKTPAWLGTGLEDYFNGGWYYQNVMARPLHGLPFKAFFRTVQYRLHLADPVTFGASLDMEFERGPDHASPGWMESVSYYYLDRPAAASGKVPPRPERAAVEDPMARATLMLELWNHERFGDYEGARAAIDAFLERFPGFEYAGVLRLRQAAYDERLHGVEAAREVYETIAARETNTLAGAYARLLLWYHADPRHALLGVYCNTPTRVFLDGAEVGVVNDPQQMKVWPRVLTPGRHALALQASHRPYPDWVQLCLRTHARDVVTAPYAWKHAFDPPGAWSAVDYDDRSWRPVEGTGTKGPPEEPYTWVVPDPFVDMQSSAVGLRPSMEWPQPPRTVVYRTVFEIP